MSIRKPVQSTKPADEAPGSVNAAILAATRVVEDSASMTAPVMSRAQSARNHAQQRQNQLARERADFVDQISLLKAQVEAAIEALQAHIDDIDEEAHLYANGFSPSHDSVVKMAAE